MQNRSLFFSIPASTHAQFMQHAAQHQQNEWRLQRKMDVSRRAKR